MILQSLYDYFERRKDEFPPLQMALVCFKYAILIDEKGNFKGFEALGDEDGAYLLAYRPEERTSSPVPHCLGDNGSYVLGLKDINPQNEIKISAELKKNDKNHNAFKKV